MVEPPRNEWSVVAGTFRARRGRADGALSRGARGEIPSHAISDLLQAAATPRGAFRRPPEGRAHKRPSIRMRGIPPRAPRLRAPLSALDVCRIRPRADAAHLDACGRADHSFLGGSTTRFTVVWRRLRGSNSHAREGITGFKPEKHASLASLRLKNERMVCLAPGNTRVGDPDEIRTRNYEVEGLVA